MAEVPNDIILWHYKNSPNAWRISFYLALRGISHAECLQPWVMPRPDLAELGVNYRKIPLLSIGRDVYCDTRLVLQKLEERHPDGRLGGSTGEHQGVVRLIQRWVMEGGFFGFCARSLPPNGPVINNPEFMKDRSEFFGRPWTKEIQERGRPEALTGIRDAFNLVESSFLADGRNWILNTDKPTLADIEAVWPFIWLQGVPGAVPAELASPELFPKVFAWVKRFKAAVKATGLRPLTLSSADAIKAVKQAEFAEQGGRIDEQDPTKLSSGQTVTVFPTDTGSSGKVTGKLVDLTPDEITVAVKPKTGDQTIHVHMPRLGFRAVPSGSKL